MNPNKCKNEECPNNRAWMTYDYCESCFLENIDSLLIDISIEDNQELLYKDFKDCIQGIRIA